MSGYAGCWGGRTPRAKVANSQKRRGSGTEGERSITGDRASGGKGRDCEGHERGQRRSQAQLGNDDEVRASPLPAECKKLELTPFNRHRHDPLTMKILRWIAFIPASFVVSGLVWTTIYYTNRLFLASWLVEANCLFFGYLTFVYAGAKIAPTHRAWPCVFLALLSVVMVTVNVAGQVFFHGVVQSPMAWWEMAIQLLGTGFGFLAGIGMSVLRAEDRLATVQKPN